MVDLKSADERLVDMTMYTYVASSPSGEEQSLAFCTKFFKSDYKFCRSLILNEPIYREVSGEGTIGMFL